MKLNKIILPAVAACALALGSCDDNKMEWKTPDGHGPVEISDIPLQLAEKIANYKSILEYANEYTPNMTIGLGIGAQFYMDNAAAKSLADANFTMFTTGNAMKHDAVVTNSGTLNFSTIDKFLDAIPQDAKMYGHNFIWHTQQNQTYLKSLIAPIQKVEGGEGVANILPGDATDFNGGTLGGWGAWGSNSDGQTVEQGAGQDGTSAMVLKSKADGNAWDAQCAYTFTEFLEAGKTYVIKFKAKSSVAAGNLQFQYQNGTTYGSQGGYNDFSVGTEWNDFQYEFSTDLEDVDRILLNFGKVGATYYIDDIEFGLKIEDPMTNVLVGDNSDFEGGTTGSWGSWGNSSTGAISASKGGYNSNYSYVLTNPAAGADYYVAQAGYDFAEPLIVGETYIIQFYAKASVAGTGVQFATQNTSTYSGEGYNAFTLSNEWIPCEYEYTCNAEGMNRILISFGKDAGTFYIDNVKFGVKKPVTRAATRATTITYIYKTPEEKRTALLGAMESWIKGMAEHMGNRVTGWDVINEPINDGNNGFRGIDNVFGSTDADGVQDSAPVEQDGLNLNWANNHFYWGYYLGMDYATKAFEYARKYCAPEAKLYVNEYNLETSPGKVAALIEFVNYIDTNNETGQPIVDGIGTQMHAVTNLTRTQADAMFKALAATGKLIRITELDVRIGYDPTPNPTVEQQMAQADTYRMIIESYKENVPQAQQSGFTLWSLSDNADEHTSWYPGDTPNIFDANFVRKVAYKGLCDGIAGRDISEDFTGDDWDTAYDTEEETPAE